MLEKLRNKVSIHVSKLKFIPGYYIFTVSVLIICAVIIRLTTNNTHLIYSALDNRGFFPGPFIYMLGYFIRLCLSSVILGFCTFSRRIYEERVKVVALSLLCAVMMLLEYKLIFGGVSLVLAIFFSIICPLCAVLAFISVRIKDKAVGAIVLSYVILQIIFIIQLISLAVCL